MTPFDAQPVIDPDTAAVLAAARAATPPNYEAIPLAEGRRIFHELGRGWNEPAPPLPVAEIVSLPGPAGTLKARLYAPRTDAALPVLLYSGFGEGIDEAALSRSRVRAVLRKPIEREALRSALVAALRSPA